MYRAKSIVEEVTPENPNSSVNLLDTDKCGGCEDVTDLHVLSSFHHIFFAFPCEITT